MAAMLFPYKGQSRANKDKKIGGGEPVVVEKVMLKVVKNILLNWCLSSVQLYTSGH